MKQKNKRYERLLKNKKILKKSVQKLDIDPDIMLKIDDSYFMVFEWLEGQILKANEITEKHCEIIGKMLAEIHNIDFSKIEDNERKNIETEYFDWINIYYLQKNKINHILTN